MNDYLDFIIIIVNLFHTISIIMIIIIDIPFMVLVFELFKLQVIEYFPQF